MPDFDLSITICSWNTLEDTRACLRSLEAVRGEANFETILVDNNSEDGSPDMVADEFPWVRLEKMRRNLGFTGGHNHAFSVRKGRHIMPLNSDTVVHPGAISGLMAHLESHTRTGIVGPKLLNPDGSLQFSARRFPTPIAALFRNTPLGKLFPNNKFVRAYLMEDFDHSATRPVDWVSGAAFIARQELVDEIGLFDPEYFMYCEDVDICWRAWKADYEVIYLPTAVITHAIGTSTDKAPNRMIGRFHRSMLRFYTKNMLPERPLLLRPFALAGAAVAVAGRASIFILRNKMDAVKRRFH
ncbi:glycosyltransferase family 2 protein [soil metagenome]